MNTESGGKGISPPREKQVDRLFDKEIERVERVESSNALRYIQGKPGLKRKRASDEAHERDT